MGYKCVVGEYTGEDISRRMDDRYSRLRPPNSYGQKQTLESCNFFAFMPDGTEPYIVIAKAIPPAGERQTVIIKAIGRKETRVDLLIADAVKTLGIATREATPDEERMVSIEDTLMPLT